MEQVELLVSFFRQKAVVDKRPRLVLRQRVELAFQEMELLPRFLYCGKLHLHRLLELLFLHETIRHIFDILKRARAMSMKRKLLLLAIIVSPTRPFRAYLKLYGTRAVL